MAALTKTESSAFVAASPSFSGVPSANKRTPGSPTRQQRRTVGGAARAKWKSRMLAYFALKAPHKTEADVEAALTHYEQKDGGYELMWKMALQKFGEMPPADQMRAVEERIHWVNKLRAFYALVDSSKTDHDVSQLVDRFIMEGRSYEELWQRVQEKYGIFLDRPMKERVPTPREQNSSSFRKGGSPQRADDAYRPRAPPALNPPKAMDSRTAVIVYLTGVNMKLFARAGPETQGRFNESIRMELKEIIQLPPDFRLAVSKVSAHVDGVVVELDAILPDGWTAEHVGNELIRKVTSGECTVASIRRAYLEQLGGDPHKVFIIDAAVIEYRTTLGMRYNVQIQSSKQRTNLLRSGGDTAGPARSPQIDYGGATRDFAPSEQRAPPVIPYEEARPSGHGIVRTLNPDGTPKRDLPHHPPPAQLNFSPSAGGGVVKPWDVVPRFSQPQESFFNTVTGGRREGERQEETRPIPQPVVSGSSPAAPAPRSFMSIYNMGVSANDDMSADSPYRSTRDETAEPARSSSPNTGATRAAISAHQRRGGGSD